MRNFNATRKRTVQTRQNVSATKCKRDEVQARRSESATLERKATRTAVYSTYLMQHAGCSVQAIRRRRRFQDSKTKTDTGRLNLKTKLRSTKTDATHKGGARMQRECGMRIRQASAKRNIPRPRSKTNRNPIVLQDPKTTPRPIKQRGSAKCEREVLMRTRVTNTTCEREGRMRHGCHRIDPTAATT